jgi:hypothetical protein
VEETPDSTGRWRSRLRRPALALTALATVLPLAAGTTTSAQADPGDIAKLRQLNKQINRLDKQYGGDLAKLKDAEHDARKAAQKARELGNDLTAARSLVAELAATQYMTGGSDPSVSVLAADDPSNALSNLSLASHVASNQSAKVQQIQKLINDQEKARAEADKKIKDLEQEIKDLRGQKRRVEQLIKKYKPESPSVGMGGVTARMLKAKNEIDVEFGPFPTIGCYRGGVDAQDHATGTACDFMVSTGGSYPSAAGQAQGDKVAQYAINNASKLGIKYVIWKQRIYDMRSPGWDPMSDRGGITANHFDHVHISVF